MSGVQVRGSIKARTDGKFDDRLAATIGERLIALEKANRGTAAGFTAPELPAFGPGSPGGAPGEPGPPGPGGGVTDHGALTGLEDDDHPQYLQYGYPVMPQAHVHSDEELVRPKLDIQLEDSLVARRETLDFKNSPTVAWTVEDDVLPADLLALWRMEEATGKRLSPTGLHLTEFGGAIGNAAGKVGNAVSLDGAHCLYIDSLPLPQPPVDFTVCAWVWLASKPAHQMGIISKWEPAGDNRQYALIWDNATDRFVWAVSSDGTVAAVGDVDGSAFAAPALSNWHFVVAYHDSVANLLGLSVDGGTVQTSAWATGVFPTGVGAVNVGAHMTLVGGGWHGRLDEMRFFSRVLTQAEIWSYFTLSPPAHNNRVLVRANVPNGSTVPSAHRHLKVDVADLRPDDAEYILAARIFGG